MTLIVLFVITTTFYIKCAHIYYRFRYIAAYWSKIATPCIRRPPLPLGVKRLKTSDLCNNPWSRKTTMTCLSDSERNSMICSLFSWLYTVYVCDRRTDGQTDGLAIPIPGSRDPESRDPGPSSQLVPMAML